MNFNRKYTIVFVLGFTIGSGMLGFAIYQTLTGNRPNASEFIMAGIVVLTTVLLLMIMVANKAQEIFKKHNLNWKQEIFEVQQ